MPEWFDAVIFGATLPFRATAEVVLAVPTFTTTLVSETLQYAFDSDHEFDPTRDYKAVRNIYGKAAGVGLGVGAIVVSGGTAGLVLAGAAACNGASNMNQKAEKVLNGCSSSEEMECRIGMVADACGIAGNTVSLAANGMGFQSEYLGHLKLISRTVGVPLNFVMKITPEAYRKYQKMSPAEQAIEAAALGLSTYKFHELLVELGELYFGTS